MHNITLHKLCHNFFYEMSNHILLYNRKFYIIMRPAQIQVGRQTWRVKLSRWGLNFLHILVGLHHHCVLCNVFGFLPCSNFQNMYLVLPVKTMNILFNNIPERMSLSVCIYIYIYSGFCIYRKCAFCV
jgi:hypothetical protein